MPPKGSDSNNRGGAHNKQSAKIKKPSLQTTSNSKGKGNTRGGARGSARGGSRGSRSIADEDDINNDLNNSINSTLVNPQEENNWLNELPPVIKPDEELHLKLLKERKEKDEKKHFDFCQSELKAILNLSLAEVDIPSNDRNEFLIKTKVDFFNGFYHDPISNTPRTPKTNRSNNSTSLQTMLNKNEYEINNKNSDFFQLKQSIRQLIDSNSMSVEDAFKYFNLQTSEKSEEAFDVNPELNKIFTLVHKEMQPYMNQNDSNKLLDFPFLICIVGPPCSGKSTICQFIASHFDVFIINVVDPDSFVKTNLSSTITSVSLSNSETPSNVDSNDNSNTENEDDNNNVNSIKSPFIISSSDDKVIINSIIAQISDLPENKGVIIVNYPDTKAQFTQLDKALQTAMKKKGDGKFKTLNGLIRASMTAEEASRQVQKRLIDKSTGLIFHPIFNPPDISPNSNFITEPNPYQVNSNLNSTRNSVQTPKGNSNAKNQKNNPNLNNNDKNSICSMHPVMEVYTELALIYSKVNSQLSILDNLMKKIGPVSSIGFCNYIGQLNLLIESFLKSLYKSKNIEPPFTSFVVFETQDQFYYSKLCYNIFKIWDKECIPQFGKQISTLCNRLKQSKNKIEYLLDISMQMFSLIISGQDNRKAKTIEFIRSQNEIRDKIRQLQLIKEEKEAKKRTKQCSQLNSNEIVMILPRSNTSIAPRARTALTTTPIKQKREKAIMTMKTRNLYLRNVFPNVNISDLDNNRNIQLKTPDSIKFKIKGVQNTPTRNRNARPYTAISDIHKNLNIKSVFDSDLNKIDTDKEIEKEEAKLFELQINFYHFIWQQSIELRDRNASIIDRFIRRSPIKAFKSAIEENEKIIFDAILKRFFLVDWFSSHLVPLLEKKESDKSNNNNINNNLNNINNISPIIPNNSFNSSNLSFKFLKPNYRQGSKLNILSETAFLEQFDMTSNIVNKYNITDFPHPTLPNYNISNLKELCSLMQIEYKDCEEEKIINDDNSLRSTKSNDAIKPNYKNPNLIQKPPTVETKNNSDEDLLVDSNSFSYLMTPSNRINNMSKTPTTPTSIWGVNLPQTTAKVAASCRIDTNEIFERGKKKLYFPPIISFDHSSTQLYSSLVTCRVSSRMHSIRSEKVELIDDDDDTEANSYSNSSYDYINEEEEEDENENNKNTVDQPRFPFHFPEWRKCNRQKINQKADLTSSSSSISTNNDHKKKQENKNKEKNKNQINTNIKINDKEKEKQEQQQQIDVKKDKVVSHSLTTHRHHHHHISKEEAIRNFLTYIQNEINDQTLKHEAKVMLDIFVRFLNEKMLIENQIDNELKILRENLKKMIHQKCAKEMESFSRRFRFYRDRVDLQMKNTKKEQQFQMQSNLNSETKDEKLSNNETNIDVSDKKTDILINKEKEPDFDIDIDNLTSDSILPFDTSFMTKRCIEIFDALDLKTLTNFFDEDEENNERKEIVETLKLQKLYSYYYNKYNNENQTSLSIEKVDDIEEKKEENVIDDDIIDVPDYFVSLDDLYTTMDSFQFTEKEKLFIEANVRMKTIPEFISILYFIQSLLPKDVIPCTDPNLVFPNNCNSIFNSPTNSNAIIPDQIKIENVEEK